MTIHVTSEQCRLTVDTEWGGRPLPPTEQSTLRLGFDGPRMYVEIDAAYAADPPPNAAAGSIEGLWNFEVVEVFVSSRVEPYRYVELELGPHGHHLALAFDGPRQRSADEVQKKLQQSVQFTAKIEAERWYGRASLRLVHSLAPHELRINAFRLWGSGPRRFAVAAVLPGPEPEFHQPQHFPRFEPQRK